MTKKKTTITPEEPKLFEKFWNEYAMKLDRIAAVRAWNNLDKDLRRAAIDGIQHYREICEALGVRRMWPQGYLNHRRWEDEDPTPALPCMGGSDMHRSDATAAKGNYSPPSQGKATGRRDSGNEDEGGSLPDMAIW